MKGKHLTTGLILCMIGLVWVALGSAWAEEKTIELEIAARKLVNHQGAVRVKRGDQVSLRWKTDENVELHLHGYDIELTATPEKPAVFAFKAYATGRFPITAHGFGSDHGGHEETVLTYFEVRP